MSGQVTFRIFRARTRGLLAVAAYRGREAGDFVPSFDPETDGPTVDDTSRLEPENYVWGTSQADLARPDLQIGGADPAGPDADANLTRTWFKDPYVPPLQDVGVAVLCQYGGFGQ
jgi:hypothetical protein